jgi:hypothetical protein
VRNGSRSRLWRAGLLLALGGILGLGLGRAWRSSDDAGEGLESEAADASGTSLAGLARAGLLSPLAASLVAEAPDSAGAQDGDYLFFPNRRSVWVVNRQNGRFAYYHFRDDQNRTVDRSRVFQLDQETFPPGETVFLLSDRNLTEVLWVCNKRTGDVQLWTPRADGNADAEKPIATKIDLMERR